MASIEQRLREMDLALPQTAAPAANYLPFVQVGNLVFTAGQLPLSGGRLAATGLLGRDLDTATGQKMAQLCALNVLATAKSAIQDLERLVKVVKITCFVASVPEFTEQHLVANGASDLLVDVLGERGKHARSAVGMASLPLDAPVEIEAVLEVDVS